MVKECFESKKYSVIWSIAFATVTAMMKRAMMNDETAESFPYMLVLSQEHN